MTTRTTGAKYLAIAADLRRRIAAGEFGPGTALPPQRELSTGYGVSMMTLRQALTTLETEGLVQLRAGRDTLVVPQRPAYRLDTLRSFADDLRAQGHAVATRLVGVTDGELPAWVAEVLVSGAGADAAAPVLCLERVRLVGGVPAVHQRSWVAPAWSEAVRARPGHGADRLYEALAEVGAEVARADETVRPGLLGAAEADLLDQPVGTPLLVTDRVSYDAAGEVVLVDRASIVGSAVQMRTARTRDTVRVTWNPHPSP